jgi:hypothetical protein
MIVVGGALALLGLGSLFASFALPRIIAARERAAGIGMVDPRTGENVPRLAVASPRRVLTGVVAAGTGIALVYAGLRRTRDDGA